MTSYTEDSDLVDGKVLGTLVIASVKKLKRGNKKCAREEVSKLVNDNLCNKICKDLFNETVDSLTDKQFIVCNIVNSQEYLSFPKDSDLHHRSIQSTHYANSVHEHLNPFPLLESETNRNICPFKEEFETFKFQAISEIKNLILKELSVLKEAINTHSNIDGLSRKAEKEKFYQEQLRLMNEVLRSKSNLMVSLLNQLSKQTECITSLNYRFSNNAIVISNNNNENLSHKNNSCANESNSNNTNNNNKNKNSNNINNNDNNNFNINSNCNSTFSNKNDESNSNSNHHNYTSSKNFNNNINSLSQNSNPTSSSTNYDNVSDNNYHDSP